MYICVCRDLKESEFSSKEEMIVRISQDDYQCGKCLGGFMRHESKETNKEVFRGNLQQES